MYHRIDSVPGFLIRNASTASIRVLHGPLPSPRAGFAPGSTNNIRMQLGLVTQMTFGCQYGHVAQIIFGVGLHLNLVKFCIEFLMFS
jgi:hypothetical protein